MNLPPLIPREILFGNPERMNPQISPDGRKMAWVAPDERNVLQVWVKTIGAEGERVVTSDEKRGIRSYAWAKDNKTLLYIQDKDGDENWHLYGVDLEKGGTRDLTPFDGVQAQLVGLNSDYPDEVLVAINHREPTLHDVYRLALSTGELTLDTENPGDAVGFAPDNEFKVRACIVATPEGGSEIRLRASAESPWQSWLKVGPEEIVDFVDFSEDGERVLLLSSIGSDKARVVEREIATGTEAVLAASDEVDAGSVMLHPKKHVVQAVSFEPGRSQWHIVDESVRSDFEGIAKLAAGDFGVVNRDTADETWLVAFTADDGPVSYYAWDRKAQGGTFLFVHQPKLQGLPLAPMKPVALKARDGLALHGYLTLPVGVEAKNLPLVLYVHGGPWARDNWGYNPAAQWFANRGYACLQVNYRGSTGYGKAHLNAANRQWGLKMHDDLIDSVNWAVQEGLADSKRVAIFGGSYGGYAALAGVTFTPEFFACSVDIVGVSNIRTFIESIPPYWQAMRGMLDVRVGNVDDPADAELIANASPLFKADRIVRPLLIAQGANDPRVKQPESEQIVEAIAKHGGKATYVLYPDEGHGFARPVNQLDFFARSEAFLAEHLGGRCEPLSGERYPGSTAIVKEIG